MCQKMGPVGPHMVATGRQRSPLRTGARMRTQSAIMRPRQPGASPQEKAKVCRGAGMAAWARQQSKPVTSYFRNSV